MRVEDFEQLISDWLDEPQRDDLRAQITAALASDPALRTTLAEWQGLEPLLAGNAPVPRDVDWDLLAERITRAVQADGPGADSDAALDELLRAAPGLDGRVDWARQRAQIVAATAGRRRAGVPIGRWWQGVGAAALAAAAALLLTVLPAPDDLPTPTEVAVERTSVAQVRVSGPQVLPLPVDEAVPAPQLAQAGVATVRVVAVVEQVTTEQVLIVEPLEEAGAVSELSELF